MAHEPTHSKTGAGTVAATRLGMALTKLRTAGRDLAEIVMSRWGRPTFVFAIPRRGAVVADAAAHRLRAPMDLVLASTVALAGHRVAGVAMPDARVLDRVAIAAAGLARAEVDAACDREQAALAERLARLRGGAPLPELAHGHVVVIDDAALTGLSAAAAVGVLRQRGVTRVTVAVGYATAAAIDRLAQVADHVVALHTISADAAAELHAHDAISICPPISDDEIRQWVLAAQHDAGVDPYGDLETDGVPAP